MDGIGSYAEAVKVFASKYEVAKVSREPILCVKVSATTNEY
jgi:hypothetical protein